MAVAAWGCLRMGFELPPLVSLPTLPHWEQPGADSHMAAYQLDGRWAKPSTEDWFKLRYPDGSPLTVPPGVPWVNVFPADRPVDWQAGPGRRSATGR